MKKKNIVITSICLIALVLMSGCSPKPMNTESTLQTEKTEVTNPQELSSDGDEVSRTQHVPGSSPLEALGLVFLDLDINDGTFTDLCLYSETDQAFGLKANGDVVKLRGYTDTRVICNIPKAKQFYTHVTCFKYVLVETMDGEVFYVPFDCEYYRKPIALPIQENIAYTSCDSDAFNGEPKLIFHECYEKNGQYYWAYVDCIKDEQKLDIPVMFKNEGNPEGTLSYRMIIVDSVSYVVDNDDHVYVIIDTNVTDTHAEIEIKKVSDQVTAENIMFSLCGYPIAVFKDENDQDVFYVTQENGEDGTIPLDKGFDANRIVDVFHAEGIYGGCVYIKMEEDVFLTIVGSTSITYGACQGVVDQINDMTTNYYLDIDGYIYVFLQNSNEITDVYA